MSDKWTTKARRIVDDFAEGACPGLRGSVAAALREAAGVLPPPSRYRLLDALLYRAISEAVALGLVVGREGEVEGDGLKARLEALLVSLDDGTAPPCDCSYADGQLLVEGGCPRHWPLKAEMRDG